MSEKIEIVRVDVILLAVAIARFALPDPAMLQALNALLIEPNRARGVIAFVKNARMPYQQRDEDHHGQNEPPRGKNRPSEYEVGDRGRGDAHGESNISDCFMQL